ncbi:MAG: YraN family protein [Andreesenia angusta]|nr:YraN family protein [Andreesenia angusta]
MKNHEFGKIGEDLASIYLEKKNHKIIERNFNIRHGEIDIISIVDDFIVFTEVKSRSNLNMGRPSESIDYKKINRIREVAEYYFYLKKDIEKQPRFDILEVMKDNNKIRINHIENAF